MSIQRNAKLEAVLGRSTVNVNTVSVDNHGTVATVSGCTIVLWDSTTSKERHIICDAQRIVSCIHLSPCGRYLAVGETGHEACVRVFRIRDSSGEAVCDELCAFAEHKVAVAAVCFVDNAQYVVSVGSPHDGTIALWNISSMARVATSRLSATVHRICASPDGSTCVTVGVRHVKFWFMPTSQSKGSFEGKTAILADRRSSTFCDCIFADQTRLFTTTLDGTVVEFVNKKYVRAFEWKSKATSVALFGNSLVVGCNDDVVLYSLDSMDEATSERLPKVFYNGIDVATATEALAVNEQFHPPDARYPQVVTVAACASTPTLTIGYADKSVITFTRHNNSWVKRRTHIDHCGTVDCIEVYPSTSSFLPAGSILTGGTDGTVRIYNHTNANITHESIVSRNFISSTLLKTLYLIQNDLSLLETEEESLDGIRSLRISPNGEHLVAGSRKGTLFFVNIATPEMNLLQVTEAHDGDVIALDFCPNGELFVSGARDRLVHLFASKSNIYEHIATIDDHQSTLVALRFLKTAEELLLLTCSTDRSIVIWKQNKESSFERVTQIATPTSLCGIDVVDSKSFVAASYDRQLRTYDTKGKMLATVKATVGDSNKESSHLVGASLDHSCTFAATLSSDRLVYIVHLSTGQCVAVLGGIAQQATAVAFSNDFKRVYVTSANGCVYVWRLAKNLVERMQQAEIARSDDSRSVSPTDSVLDSGIEGSGVFDHIEKSSSRFGSSSSLVDCNEFVPLAPSTSTSNDLASSLVVRTAQVTRRSTSNLQLANNAYRDEVVHDESDEESRSEFVSRRNEPVESELPSSRSMMNLRDENTSRRARAGWGAPATEFRPARTTMLTEPTSAVRSPGLRLSTPTRDPSSDAMSSALSRIQAINARSAPSTAFERDSHRVSLSKKHSQQTDGSAMWTPQRMAPRRTTSSMQQTPSGAAASAITRRQAELFKRTPSASASSGVSQPTPTTSAARAPRPTSMPRKDSHQPRADESFNSSYHLRSRSQSPNQLMADQMSSSQLTKQMKQRRDSDMSYTSVSSRLVPSSSKSNLGEADTRKSTEALNRIAQLRSKLHQSTENLRKSSDNLAEDGRTRSTSNGRTRSISNLHGTQLESFSTFDADRSQTTAQRSLGYSRLAARSMGNVSCDSNETPAERLQNTLDMLKKASNPDLTNSGLYDDSSSPLVDKMRRRGAVQKKVERYHPKNRRPQTSEDSDTSDQSPLNQSINRIGFNARSVSSVEPSSRRLYDANRMTTARRTTNYLAQKMNGEDLGAPDLGSDDSPRSSVNPCEWLSMLGDDSSQQLVLHVQDCLDQLQIYTDKTLQAKLLVEESSLRSDQKKVILAQIEQVEERISGKMGKNTRSAHDGNGNDYAPIKGPIMKVLKQNLSSRP